MDELASIFGYNQETIEGLNQKLFYTTMELDSVKVQANEEKNKYRETLNLMLQHLKTACKERDDTRVQIQKLLNKIAPINPQTGIINSPILAQPSKANSSITESNSLSDNQDYQCPSEPLLDIVSSPNSSNLGYINPLHHEPTYIFDRGSLVIDRLAKGKTLPQKGKLFEAVQNSGPLLKNLLVPNPLPRWPNPPPVQSFQSPPLSMKGCNSEIVKQGSSLGQANNKFPNVFSPSDTGYGIFQMPLPGSLMQFNKGERSANLVPWASDRNFNAFEDCDFASTFLGV